MSGQLSLQDFLKDVEYLPVWPLRAYGWRLWDPRVKLVLSLLAMGSNVLFAQAWLSERPCCCWRP